MGRSLSVRPASMRKVAIAACGTPPKLAGQRVDAFSGIGWTLAFFNQTCAIAFACGHQTQCQVRLAAQRQALHAVQTVLASVGNS